MGVKHRQNETAVRRRTAAFLLLLGLVLPLLLPNPGRLRVPGEVEELLMETLAGEKDPARLTVVRTACTLVGRVRYFWGGKSAAGGWDWDWGRRRRVSAPGSSATGTWRPYGLDCSGFVSWAAGEGVGEGVRQQYARCVPTGAPRPGDLAFFPDLSHVGIYLGGGYVVHCSYSLGGVVVTRVDVGFTLFGTPAVYSRPPTASAGKDKEALLGRAAYGGMARPGGRAPRSLLQSGSVPNKDSQRLSWLPYGGELSAAG